MSTRKDAAGQVTPSFGINPLTTSTRRWDRQNPPPEFPFDGGKIEVSGLIFHQKVPKDWNKTQNSFWVAERSDGGRYYIDVLGGKTFDLSYSTSKFNRRLGSYTSIDRATRKAVKHMKKTMKGPKRIIVGGKVYVRKVAGGVVDHIKTEGTADNAKRAKKMAAKVMRAGRFVYRDVSEKNVFSLFFTDLVSQEDAKAAILSQYAALFADHIPNLVQIINPAEMTPKPIPVQGPAQSNLPQSPVEPHDYDVSRYGRKAK